MNIRISVFLCLAIISMAHCSFAQVCDSNAFAPDSMQFCTSGGPVYASLKVGNRMFIAGEFKMVGKPTGAFIGIDTVTGSAHPVNQATWPKIQGLVYTSIPDGNGGWFVGGDFLLAGDSARNNIVQINSAGQVTSFRLSPNGDVRSLALSGNILYIGGVFTGIGSTARNHIASYDLAAGTLTSWNPDCNNNVGVITIDGSTVWLGGKFTTVGSSTRNRLAAVDNVTGSVLAQNPNANDSVNTIVVSGNSLFVGGQFTSIAGVPRSFLAALDKTTGTALPWVCDVNGTVNVIKTYGTNLIVGGLFGNVNTVSVIRTGVMMVAQSNAALQPFNPQMTLYNVRCLDISGNTLYAGNVRQVPSLAGPKAISYIAAFDLTTSALLNYQPQIGTPPLPLNYEATVLTMHCYNGKLFVGGISPIIGCYERPGLAAIDLANNVVDTWKASGATDAYYSALATSNDWLYAGCSEGINSIVRRFSLTTGAYNTSWAPPVTRNAAMFSSRINRLIVDSSFVYVGGNYRIPQSLSTIVAALKRIDTLNGNINSWSPDFGIANTTMQVLDMRFSNNKIFVTGLNMPGPLPSHTYVNSYTLPGGTSYTNEIDATRSAPMTGTIRVNSLGIAGDKLILSGIFSTLNGANRPGIGAIYTANTANVSPWTPQSSTINGYATGLDVWGGNRVFASVIPGALPDGEGICVFDTSSNTRLFPAWRPRLYASGFQLLSADTMFAFGDFTKVSGRLYPGLVRFHLSKYPTLSVAITTPNSTLCPGASATFTANASPGVTYQWIKNGVNAGNGSSYTYVPAYGDSVRCVVTAAGNVCYSSTATTASSNTIIITIATPVTPSVSVAASPGTVVCTGTSVTFTATPANGGTSPTYQWLLNGSSTGTNAPTYNNTSLATGDIVSCTLTSNAQCTTTPTASAASPAMTVHPLPTPAISYNGTILSSGISGTSYIWYLGGNPISGATSQTHTPVVNGTYTVAVTDANGCKGTSAPFIVGGLSITANTGINDISYYPNPAQTIVHVMASSPVDIAVLSVEGKLLLSSPGSRDIDVRSLPGGTYILRLSDTNGRVLRTGVICKMAK